ncbi:MAG: TIGR00269 family protein [Candidatus Thermoplasmatota archaeon]
MTIQCSKCVKPAVTYIRYNGSHLCKDHFREYFERRVKKDLKKQGKTFNPCVIAVALSGGKDSAVTLHIINKIFKSRPKVEIHALTVDEGIKGYRDKSLLTAEKICKQLGIPHHVISFKDVIGTTMDDIALMKDEIGECSYCGVFRRLCLNKKSKELGADKLATGHNLDDVAQSILMNFVNNDLEKLARFGPHQRIQPGLIPRIMPLRSIPENEVMLYAVLEEIDFHYAECPYSIRALRGDFRSIVDLLEDKYPGSRHGILNSYERLRDVLQDQYIRDSLNTCSNCGEPTSQKVCKTCLLLERIRSNITNRVDKN